jgi:hypothetical protein
MDQNTVPNSGVVSMGSLSGGDEAEGMTSLASPGSGQPRGINEAGVAIPTGYEGQGNGVRMPGPMSSGFEDGWMFNDDGDDPSGVANYQGYIQGVQLNGGPNEEAWNFGQDFSGLEQQQPIPTTNQNFGVFEGGPYFDGDDSIGGRVVGRVGNNYDMVQAGDIMSVFSAIVPDGGQGAISPSGPVAGQDSMSGIPLGPGSGPYTGGEQNTFSTGDLGDH